jgi:hypothetical protein
VDGLIQNWMLDPDAFDLVRVGKQVLSTYLGGLRTRSPAQAPVKPSARSAGSTMADVAALGSPIAP